MLPKRSLIRIVRSPEGVTIDPSGKVPGRGAYLHDEPSCWEVGLRGSLARALRTEISSEAQKELVAFMHNLAEELNG